MNAKTLPCWFKTNKQAITTDDEVGKNIAASYEDKK